MAAMLLLCLETDQVGGDGHLGAKIQAIPNYGRDKGKTELSTDSTDYSEKPQIRADEGPLLGWSLAAKGSRALRCF